MRKVYLSKTDYVRYQTCPAWSWAMKHKPDLAPAYDLATLRSFARGYAVEALALQLYPDGVHVDAHSPRNAAQQTRELVRDGVTTLFQAGAFTDFGLVARADVLYRDNQGWHLIEIKSSSSSKSDARKIQKRYLDDVTFQAHAFTDAGFDLASVSVLHLNHEYRRSGPLRLEELLLTTELTSEVHGVFETTGRRIETALAMMNEPDLQPDCGCHLIAKSNRCDLFAVFHPEFATGDSILELRLSKEKLQQALNLGCTSFLDLPESFPLTEKQRETVEFRRNGQPLVDTAILKQLLDEYEFPLYFYDYEAFSVAVPLFENCAPYEAIPFQYSLHILHQDGSCEHRQFLWTERDEDPAPHVANQLLADIGPHGTLLAWNAAYESGCNTRIADRYPEFREGLLNLNERTRDLAHVVSKKGWVHPGFGGSWSLKNVLPVADPDLTYDELEISNGSYASERWMQAMIDPVSEMEETERNQIFADLRTYCRLDTWGMVRVWQRAQELLGRSVDVREVQ